MVPLDFQDIQQRLQYVRWGTSASDVVRLLGPPSSDHDVGLASIEQEMQYHPDRYGGDVSTRLWLKWSDPNNKDKWVLVLLLDNRVYLKYQKGY